MNNFELERSLKGYPVTVCAAEQLEIRRGRFVISNTDRLGGPGKHWVTFYFPHTGPDEFFDSLGKWPEDYNVNFEKALRRRYWINRSQIQDSDSDVCGLYCIYYVMERFAGKRMKDIVVPFDVKKRKQNDEFIVSYFN